MKVVILAGGLGTRLAEETITVPKPMVQIGQHPILWHIMKFYASYGFEEFVVALGYKAEVVKNFFLRRRDGGTSPTSPGDLEDSSDRYWARDTYRRPRPAPGAAAR